MKKEEELISSHKSKLGYVSKLNVNHEVIRDVRRTVPVILNIIEVQLDDRP